MMKADRAQLAKIHIAQKQLGIDKETKLQNYAPYGVQHSNDLSYDEAEELINKYIEAGFKTSPRPSPNLGEGGFSKNWGKNKYTELDMRGYPFAASSKLRQIEVLWREVSRSKTDESLQVFIRNLTGVDHITFMHDIHAKKVLTALQAMKRQIPRQTRNDR